MHEEKENFSLKSLLIILIVIGFGWGALWSGTKGFQLMFGSSPSGSHAYDLTANIEDTSKTTEDASDLTTTTNPPLAKNANQSNPISTVTVILGGDVMFDRAVRALGEKNGYESLFSEISPLFKKADIVAVNLEGPITSNPSKTLLNNGKTTKALAFTFHPKTASALANVGITMVSLANNHTDNFGWNGFLETKKWLTEAGVMYFGDPWNSSSTEAVITKNGITVAFVGYHSFQSGLNRTLSEIKRLKDQNDFVIVMPHWGEEYVATTSSKLRDRARAFITAGADAVIGSHPHVIMDHEMIGGVPVFYSLGNLLFDQYFSPEVMKGNLVELKITKDSNGTKLSDIKIYETSTESRRGVEMIVEPIDIKFDK